MFIMAFAVGVLFGPFCSVGHDVSVIECMLSDFCLHPTFSDDG